MDSFCDPNSLVLSSSLSVKKKKKKRIKAACCTLPSLFHFKMQHRAETTKLPANYRRPFFKHTALKALFSQKGLKWLHAADAFLPY